MISIHRFKKCLGSHADSCPKRKQLGDAVIVL